MRRVLVVLGVVLLAGSWAGAQASPEAGNPDLTQGQLAVLLLKVGQPQGPSGTPDEALQQCKELGLLPAEWTGDGIVTHGDLADVVGQYGIVYTAADRSDPVSRAFAEAYLRRHVGKLREFISQRLGHEASVNHIMDLGIDRAVSPSDFQ